MMQGLLVGNPFRNMRTMTKIMLAFSAVGALMAVIGFLGVQSIQQTRNHLQGVYEHSRVALVSPGTIHSTLESYHHHVLTAVQATDRGTFENAIKSLPELRRKTLEPLEGYPVGELHVTADGRHEGNDVQALKVSLGTYFTSAEGTLMVKQDEFVKELSAEERALLEQPDWQALATEVAANFRIANLRAEELLSTAQEVGKELNETGQAVAHKSIRMMIMSTLVAISLVLGVGFLLARFFSRGITHVVDVAKEASAGNLQARVHLDSRDELGQMGMAVNALLNRMTTLAQSEEEGHALQGRLMEFLTFVSEVSKGDLSKRGTVTEDMLGNLTDALNLMVDRFSQLMKQVKLNAVQVKESAVTLRNTAGQLAETSQHQTGESQRTLEAIEGLTQSMRQVAERATASSESAKQALDATERGRGALQETLRDMQGIRDAVQRLSKQVKSLGDRSLEISQIVSTIKELSSHTNLLALNAAIEAAGAGEAGARFAVVADQVHKLAESSTQATHEVADLVKVIQTETQDVVVAMERETQAVEAGSASALRTGNVFKEISGISQRASELAESIAESARQQATSTEKVAESIWEFKSGAVETQKAAEETHLTVEEMAKLAEGMTASVDRFKVA